MFSTNKFYEKNFAAYGGGGPPRRQALPLPRQPAAIHRRRGLPARARGFWLYWRQGLSWTVPHETKTPEVAAVAGVVAEPDRTPEVRRIAAPPTPATDHPVRACLRTTRIASRAFLVIVTVIPVSAPFPHIPALLITPIPAHPIWVAMHKGCLLIPLVLVIAALLPFFPLSSPRIHQTQRPSRCLLPLRLARQLQPSPLPIRHTIIPRYAYHRMFHLLSRTCPVLPHRFPIIRLVWRPVPRFFDEPGILPVRHAIHPHPILTHPYLVLGTAFLFPVPHLILTTRNTNKNTPVLPVHRQGFRNQRT